MAVTYKHGLLIGLVALACGGCATAWQSNGDDSALTAPRAAGPQCREGVYNRAAGICLSPGSQ